ncbi:MAG: hypothetical protein M3Y53_03410 [Thermoproteota archaeon]|nr:hypothetical protein [Thermoproteota archaeon]
MILSTFIGTISLAAPGQVEQLVFTKHTSLAHVQHMQQQLQQPQYPNQFPQPTQNSFPPQQTYQQPQYPQQLQQQFTNQQQPTYQSNQTSQPLYNPGKVIACQNKVLSDAITSIHTLPASPAFIQNATTVLDNCIMPTK